ncbi:MAG: 3-isopropylmalate dehydrogenase [Streptosporangiales bacterium]|nr:3-isopropylmalate dehydrogenase [Streptosporangiales bacterium]
MRYDIAVLGGDGVGPSVVAQAAKVLAAVEERWPHRFVLTEHAVGAAALAADGTSLPAATLDAARASAAVLFGAVGDPALDRSAGEESPTAALLRLRRELRLHTGIRPVALPGELADLASLRVAEDRSPIDLVIVRDLSAGLFHGIPRGRRWSQAGVEEAFDTMSYTTTAIARTACTAFEIARRRRASVVSVDQANVLESSALWREEVTRTAAEYPDVRLEHVLVDNCANELVRRPDRYDVILTDGLFGGILSDEAGAVTGSIGMLASASVGDGPGIFEPVHGSAPRHAGRDEVNPIGTIRALAMLLDLALGLSDAARAVEEAVVRTVAAGHRTYDIAAPGGRVVGTDAMGDAIAAAVARP